MQAGYAAAACTALNVLLSQLAQTSLQGYTFNWAGLGWAGLGWAGLCCACHAHLSHHQRTQAERDQSSPACPEGCCPGTAAASGILWAAHGSEQRRWQPPAGCCSSPSLADSCMQ